MSNVFLWMFLGLMITFGVAIGTWMSGVALVVLSMGGFLGITIAQFVAVIALSAFVEKLSVGAARGWFIAYSVLTGLTVSVNLYVFELGSLVFVFLITALFFGALGLYGHRTQSDLSGLRPYLISGLVVLIVYGIISIFVPMGVADVVMTLGGVLLFLAFTAYDVQRSRYFYEMYRYNSAMLEKAAIYSALQLYLDFINLFLRLLRYLGKRRD
jgi:FtsH-binding integral membrane protein